MGATYRHDVFAWETTPADGSHLFHPFNLRFPWEMTPAHGSHPQHLPFCLGKDTGKQEPPMELTFQIGKTHTQCEISGDCPLSDSMSRTLAQRCTHEACAIRRASPEDCRGRFRVPSEVRYTNFLRNSAGFTIITLVFDTVW